MDRIVGWSCLFIGGMFLGMVISEERAAVALKPCPQQTGFINTSSTWTKERGLQCRYEPTKVPKKL